MLEVKNLGPFVLPSKATAPRSFWWWRDLIAEQTDMGSMGALMWLTERASKPGATCSEDGMRNPRAVDPTHTCLAPADVGEWLAAAFARPITYEASATAPESSRSIAYEAESAEAAASTWSIDDQGNTPSAPASTWSTAYEAECAAPAPVAAQARKATRRDVLDPVIEQAQRQCSDPWDVAEVWSRLIALADAAAPRRPIIGRDREAIKYDPGNDPEEVKFFKRSDLAKRLKRRAASGR